jgi:hypothetical protein
VIAAGYFLWLCAHSVYSAFAGWREKRDLAQLQAEYRARRKENALRLGNGCDHQYTESSADGLPPDVCRKCGLSRQKPPGDCDHVWRVVPKLVPTSRCEKCGQTYGGLTSDHGE